MSDTTKGARTLDRRGFLKGSALFAAVLGADVALRPEQVGSRVRIDGRDASSVPHHVDLPREPLDHQLAGHLREGSPYRRNRQDRHRHEGKDDEDDDRKGDSTGEGGTGHAKSLGHASEMCGRRGWGRLWGSELSGIRMV